MTGLNTFADVFKMFGSGSTVNRIQQGTPFDIFGNWNKLFGGGGTVNWNATPNQAGKDIATPVGMNPLFPAGFSIDYLAYMLQGGKSGVAGLTAGQIATNLGGVMGAPTAGLISTVSGGVGAGAAQVGAGVGMGAAGLGTGIGAGIAGVGAGVGAGAEAGMGNIATGLQQFMPLIIFGIIAYVLVKAF